MTIKENCCPAEDSSSDETCQGHYTTYPLIQVFGHPQLDRSYPYARYTERQIFQAVSVELRPRSFELGLAWPDGARAVVYIKSGCLTEEMVYRAYELARDYLEAQYARKRGAA